jgi:P-type E1-E2 ATPase
LRKRADSVVNNRKIKVLSKNGVFEEINSKNIKCGDIVEVREDEFFPCDLLLVYSKAEHGSSHNCHVKTSNLDGETNLKV